MTDSVITLEGIGKQYRRFSQNFLYRDIVRWIMGRRAQQADFWALRNVTLEVNRGESVGIIGENGSGKSTLLKVLSNVTDPTCGRITIDGRVSALLELGAGFHPQLTGRENIYLNGVILGMPKKDIDRLFDRIVEFSGIGEFIDQPVMTYSSGMYVRLGFAIAIHVDPDILIIDEVLAVGDEEFQRKCKKAIHEFHERGKTILFVSHDLAAIRELCTRVYWLRKGEIRMVGGRDEVTFSYLNHVSAIQGLATLTRGSLTLLFERGKLILFWRGIELTKNCCIFTEVLSSSNSQASMGASWDILEFDQTKLTVRGAWKLFPVEQTWRVELLNEHTIRWNVEMTLPNDFNLRSDSISFMLTDRYTSWFTSTDSGSFPEEFHDTFGQRIIGIGDGTPEAGVQERILSGIVLPSIRTCMATPSGRFFVQVTNTDAKLQSRTIQYSRIESKDHQRNPPICRYEIECIIGETTHE